LRRPAQPARFVLDGMDLGLGMNSVSGAVRTRRHAQAIGCTDDAAPVMPAPIIAAGADAACTFEIVSSRDGFDALAPAA
jgi:hypothetical protein